MVGPYNPPTNGEDFIFTIGLQDINDMGSFLVDPAIAAGDFKISKDNGALADLNTTPSVAPAGSRLVKVTLSPTEMTTDGVTVIGVDQSNPKLWADFLLFIPTTAP